jgi:hypothetical protein
MRVAALASRRTPLVALAALSVAASLTAARAPQAAVSSGARVTAKLPAALWGVEVDARAARTFGARRLGELKRSGINALVVDPAKVRGAALAGLRRRSARARLLVIVPRAVRKGAASVTAARALCRGAGRCVVMAPSAASASRLSRAAGVDLVVVRVSGAKGVSRLGATSARRLLALARLTPSPKSDAASWRAAIRSARASTRLDLAVSPRSAAALDAYLALLREQASVKPPPPPSPPPGPPPPPPPGGAGGVPVYTKDNPPATPTLAQLPKVTSLSKDGVTWTFSEPESVGRFITGDYYVVGNATVSAISPAPANGRNGSVKNIPPGDSDSGFDDRTDANRYEASLRVALPVNLVPGDSLVSSISVDTVGQLRRWLFDKAAGSPVRSLSILTSVAAPQPPDAFRPSYVGKGAPIHYSRNLRRDLLPKLAAVAGMPSLGEWEQHFRRPWVDNVFFNFDNPVEYMPDYSREIARAVGTAGLLLSLSFTAEQKEPLLVYLTQYGIDLYGLVKAGHPGWKAHGGHGSGRKFPIVFAGTMLELPAMQSPPGKSGEDMQTMFGTGWTGATALYAGHYGSTSSGQYGPYEHLQPSSWPGTLGEDYRRCCTSSAWIGEALAARLIPGMQAAWNHAPFFAYADRWMTEDDTAHLATIKTQTGKDYSGLKQRKAWDAFATNMWKAYRG